MPGDLEPLTGSPNVTDRRLSRADPGAGAGTDSSSAANAVQGADPPQDDVPEDDETERED